MKNITAILLSSVLLLTATFVAIPLSAAADATTPAPIEATPFVIDSVTYEDTTTFTLADVTPSTFTSASGKRITLNQGKDFYSVDATTLRGKYIATFIPVSGTKVTADETHFMFRFEANGPSSFCIRLDWATSWLYLNSGATVEVLKDGATQWETKTVTTTANSNQAPQIQFDEAFSGYIKFAYLDSSIIPGSERELWDINFYTYGMGTVGENTYATEMTVGPFFTVTSDSASTVINVPDEFKPAPIEATPLSINDVVLNANIVNGLTVADAAPLSFTSEIGKCIALKTGGDFYSVNSDGRGSYGFTFNLADATKYKDDTHVIIRFEANGKSSFNPRLVVSGSWCELGSGATVGVLKDGETQWKSKVTTNDTPGQIQFDEAFSGYIKIAYSSFSSIPTDIDRPITRIDIYTYGMGKVGENTYATEMTVGPFFTVTSDSTSTEINVPDEFKHQPIEAKPLVLGDFSANALATNVTVADAQSLSSTFENGKTFTLNSGKDFYGVRDNGRGSAGFTFNMNAETTVNQGETHLMFHFKANGPAVFNPLVVSNNYWYYLKSSTTVEVLEDGDTNWKTIQTSEVVNPSDPWSQIQFNEAFSGMIKIAYSDLGLSFSDTITSYSVNKIDFYIYGMGEGEGYSYATEMSVGAFYSVTSDSKYNEIDVDTVNGDVNVDGLVNARDLCVVRLHIIAGTDDKYLNKFGNLNGDEYIDILDLVKISTLL